MIWVQKENSINLDLENEEAETFGADKPERDDLERHF